MTTFSLEITIRFVQAAEQRPLHAVCYPHLPVAAFAEHFARLLRWQANGRACWLVAVLDDALVGSGQLVRYSRAVELANLVVAPAWRRQGIGRQLLRALRQTAAARWPDLPLELRVLADNAPALALYREAGFEVNGRVPLPAGPTLILRETRAL